MELFATYSYCKIKFPTSVMAVTQRRVSPSHVYWSKLNHVQADGRPGADRGTALPAAVLTSGLAPGAHSHRVPPASATQLVRAGRRGLELRIQPLASSPSPRYFLCPRPLAAPVSVNPEKMRPENRPPARRVVPPRSSWCPELPPNAFPVRNSETATNSFSCLTRYPAALYNFFGKLSF